MNINIATLWSGQNFQYKNGYNSTLCHHLDCWHRDDYYRLCEKYGWPNKLKSFQDALEATKQAGGSGRQLQRRVEYSKDEFLKLLATWIIASDQVRSITLWLPIAVDWLPSALH